MSTMRANSYLDSAGGNTATINGITPISLATANSHDIGVGQTWQNVTASRAFSTTYTNTTGRPIMVSIAALNNTNASWAILTVTVGGVVAGECRSIQNQSLASLSFIVPTGATYVVTNSGTAAIIQQWSELR